jgi:hypothetical protein
LDHPTNRRCRRRDRSGHFRRQPIQANVPENPAELTIAFDKGDDVRVDDVVAYVATAKKAGYLAIFEATPDGNLTLVYSDAASLQSPTGARDRYGHPGRWRCASTPSTETLFSAGPTPPSGRR